MNRHLEEYLAYLSGVRNLSRNTVESYRRDLALLDRWVSSGGRSSGASSRGKRAASTGEAAACGQDALGITTGELRLFVSDLGAEGYESSSLNRILASVRGFFRYAARFGLREDNPASAIRNLKVPKKLPEFLFAEEAERLCALPAASPEKAVGPQAKASDGAAHSLWPARDCALLAALYTSGCRVSEIAGLTLRDLERDLSSAVVRGQGNKERRVVFATGARKALSEYLAERAALIGRTQENGAAKAALFLSSRGNPLSVRGIQFILAHYSDSAEGLRHLSPHALRHSFATTMITRGADIRVVQELLGHSSISTTQRYTHVTGEGLKRLYHRAHPHG